MSYKTVQDQAFRPLGVSYVFTFYMLALEPFRQKIEPLGGAMYDLWRGRGTTAYSDNSSIIVSDEWQPPYVEEAFRWYETVAEAKIIKDKSVGSLLGTWRGKATPPTNFMGCWSEVPTKLNAQTHTKSKNALFLEVAQTFIAPVITYRLTIVPCSDSWLNKMERIILHFLWKGGKPLLKFSVWCQNLLKVRIGVTKLNIRKSSLRLRHLCFYSDVDQVWTPNMRFCLPRLTSLKDIEASIKQKPRPGDRLLECCQAFQCLSRTGDASSRISTAECDRWLFKSISFEVLAEAPRYEENPLINLFRRTFESKYLDNYQAS